MSYMSFPENFMIIPALCDVGSGAAMTTLPISMKNVQKLWAVVYIHPVGAAYVIVPQLDALVAFGDPATIPATLHNVPIWANESLNTAVTWVKQADGANFTTTADATIKMVVFEIDPSIARTTATAADDHDCFRISLSGSVGTDYIAVLYIIQPRYPSAVASQASYIVN
jgi:hypothetical protein